MAQWGIPTPQLVVQEGITGPLVLDARVQRVLEKFQKEIAKLADAVADASAASGAAAEEVKTAVRLRTEVLGKGLFAEIQYQASIVQDAITASERSLQMQIEAAKAEVIVQLDQHCLSLAKDIGDAAELASRQALAGVDLLEAKLDTALAQRTAELMERMRLHQQYLISVLKADRDNTIERRLWRFLRRPLWKTRA